MNIIPGKYPYAYYAAGREGAIQAELDDFKTAHPEVISGRVDMIYTPDQGYDTTTGVLNQQLPGVDATSVYMPDSPLQSWGLLGQPTQQGNDAGNQIGGSAHELGHGLSLPHNTVKVVSDTALGNALMSGGNYTFGRSTTSLTAADCAILNVNELFNDGSISYYGPNKATVSSVHACYNPTKKAIIVAGRTATTGAAVTDVSIYHDSNEIGGGLGDNYDYDAVTWTAPIIGTDSFYFEMPVKELYALDSSLYEMKITLIQKDGNLTDVRYRYDIVDSIAHMTDPAFKPLGATITATAGSNGSISPSGATIVNCAGDQTYTITPVPGASIQDVLVDGVSVGVVTTYTFTGVNINHTISATFTAVVVNHTISASAGANGSISPNGSVSVANGTNKTFTITANAGYSIQNVVVDGISQGAISTYMFTNVTTAHTISASFVAVVVNYTITSSAGANGTITPNGATSVASGATQNYTIAANAGYAVQNVIVDGVSKGAITTYSFTNVTAAHTISASFVAVVVNYTITSSAGANGTITPNGATNVVSGATQNYTIAANAGYAIQNVIVDGVSKGAITTYSFTNVTAAHTISATFIAATTCTVPTLAGVITNVNCKGSATGSINLTVTGGSSPYTYSWTGPNGFAKSTEDISALAAGTYNVKVTATGGCSKTSSYIVTQPSSALSVSATAASVVCGSGTTSVTVTATGGTAPYTGTGVKTNQTVGSHTYTVTDSKGCTSSTTIVIANGTGPAAPAYIAGPSYNLCGGGKFVYIASAVAGAKSYTWTVPAGFSVLAGQGTCIVLIKAPSSFTQGVIKVSATNACGTSTQTSLTVYAVAGDLSSLITGPSNVTAGQKNVYSLPAYSGFTYTWVAPAGATITSGQGTNKVTIKSGSSAGYVKVTVRNACGTSSQASKYVTVGNASNSKSMAVTEEVIVLATDFKAYPNPVVSNATVTFTSAKKDTKFEVKIVDISGRTLFTKSGLTIAGLNTLQLSMGRYVNGIYLVTLLTEDKTQTQKLFKNN